MIMVVGGVRSTCQAYLRRKLPRSLGTRKPHICKKARNWREVDASLFYRGINNNSLAYETRSTPTYGSLVKVKGRKLCQKYM